MVKAVISADIIGYTSLDDINKEKVDRSLINVLGMITDNYNVYGRIIKGDYLECVIPNPAESIRIALIIKCCIKSTRITVQKHGSSIDMIRMKLFKTYGIRIAIGLGDLQRYEPERGIIDGDAIYLSGRIINEHKTHNKEKISIKRTLFFQSSEDRLNEEIDPFLALIDFQLSRATAKQCEVLYFKLMGYNEKIISEKLKIKQSTVNQHSTSAGWNAIDLAVKRLENTIKQRVCGN
ncbi:MAG: fumarate hydratase [Bacteroidetes bacterium]|nr:fumarate hydratase [Bacteroidota bacterium]